MDWREDNREKQNQMRDEMINCVCFEILYFVFTWSTSATISTDAEQTQSVICFNFFSQILVPSAKKNHMIVFKIVFSLLKCKLPFFFEVS